MYIVHYFSISVLDYRQLSSVERRLNFRTGEVRRLCRTIEIISNIAFEGNETFMVVIDEPDFVNVLINPVSTTITIVDHNGKETPICLNSLLFVSPFIHI